MKEVILPFKSGNTVYWKAGQNTFTIKFSTLILAEEYFGYLQLISQSEQKLREFNWLANQSEDFSA